MASSGGARVSSVEFAVELPLFSGPFRLLAELILDQRMDVCDVRVARVTDRFLAEGLERADGWPLEEATAFVAMCAVLLELKVGRLLPRPGSRRAAPGLSQPGQCQRRDIHNNLPPACQQLTH